MLTKNFYKLLLSNMFARGETIEITKPNGTVTTTTNSNYLLSGLSYVSCCEFATGVYGTFFGTGRTPPTMDDYKLESPITDGTLHSQSVTPLRGFEQDHARLYATHEVHNSGSNDVTITEVGVFGLGASISDNAFLLDRTVLDTPITIPAGGSKSITVAIQFNYPSA